MKHILRWFFPLFILAIPLAVDLRTNGLYDIPKISLAYLFASGGLLLFIIEAGKRKRIEVVQNRIFWLIGGFILINLVSTLLSISPILSIFGLYRRYDGFLTLLSYAALLFAFANYGRIKDITYAILIAATLTGSYAILQHFGIYIIPSLTTDRTTSLFGNPNFLAAYLLIAFPLAVTLYSSEKKRIFSLIFGLISLIILLGLFFTKTRATFLGLLVQIPFLLFLIREKVNKKRLLVFLFPLLLFFIAFGKPIIERLGSSSKDIARIGLWKGTFSVFCQYPLFGTGPEALNGAFCKNMPLEFIKHYKGAYILADKAHNEFLDIAATRGVFALLLWLLILFAIFRMGFSALPKEKLFISAFLAGILGYLVQAQFNLSLFSVTHLVWVMMGLVIGEVSKRRVIKIRYAKPILILSILAFSLISYHIGKFYLSDIYFHKAKLFSASGDRASAKIFFDKSCKANPYEREYIKEYLQFLLDIGEKERAEELGKKAIWLMADESRLYYLLAQSTENKSIDEAISFYKKAIELNPFWADPHNNLAIAYINKRDFPSAKLEFEKALYLNSDSNSYKENLGSLYIQMGYEAYERREFKEAISLYNERLKIYPGDASTIKNLASIYFKLKKYRKAKEEFLKVLVINPEDEYAKSVVKWIGSQK
ncbi:O-antigen ligase family protein [bacterium]|nr:O-antigen ligase family protein [bacterium]